MTPLYRHRFRLLVPGLVIGGWAALIGGGARAAAGADTADAPPPAYLAYARGSVDIEGGLVAVGATYPGLIDAVRVEENDEVRAGQPLAHIDDSQARLGLAITTAALAETRAALLPLQGRLAAAQRQAARLKPLLPTEAVAGAEAEKADDLVAELQADVLVAAAAQATAQARVQADQFEVDHHFIRAPLDGRIVKRTARLGNTAGPLAPLFLLAPHAPHIVRADLEERFVDKVTPGMAAEVVIENDNERIWPGRILRIGELFGPKPATGEPGARVDLRSVECIITLNTDALRIGQHVLVRIPKP